jgi:UDP-4-amino-4,6-dideoxy-N-acetyl-beta-L-altrosamine transaminase
MNHIPYGRQSVDDADVAAVVEVLRSDFLTQGPSVPAFEAALCKLTGAEHAVAVNSATSALHIACLALGAGPGDVVWTSPNTFVASANCARYCGADVDFVDIDPATRNISVEALRTKLAQAHRSGTRLPKIVIPVHFAGEPCDMPAIHALGKQYGFRIIEDASHAVGASLGHSRTGDCTWSDVTVLSFHPVKIVTTAEGGAALTRDPLLAAKMGLLRSHGITRDAALLQDTTQGAWYYEQHALGFNYRLTDLQAALGISQLRHLQAWIGRRHELADRYDEALAALPVKRPVRPAGSRSALHLYAIEINSNGATRRQVFDRLRAAGIGVNVHYIPVHLQPDFRPLGFKPGDFPQAEAYYAGALSLPMYATLTDAQQDRVVTCLREALAQ